MQRIYNWLVPPSAWLYFCFDKPPWYHVIWRLDGADLHIQTQDVKYYLRALRRAKKE